MSSSNQQPASVICLSQYRLQAHKRPPVQPVQAQCLQTYAEEVPAAVVHFLDESGTPQRMTVSTTARLTPRLKDHQTTSHLLGSVREMITALGGQLINVTRVSSACAEIGHA